MTGGSQPSPPAQGKEPPLVYVVILTWNGREDTLECLRSLVPVWNDRVMGLVVDNGSSDGTAEAVRSRFPGMEVIETGENLGYAGGNNVGIRHALDRGADYVLLLNNDTVADPPFLKEMLAVAGGSERIGFVSPKICFLDPPDLLERDRGQYDQTTEIDRPCGCAVLVSRRLCREVGLMDDQLFLYGEEVEWMLRARKRRFKACLAPKARVWHKVSASIGGENHPDAFYYGVRNTLRALNGQAPCRFAPAGWARNGMVAAVFALSLLRSSVSLKEGAAAIFSGIRDYRRDLGGPRGKTLRSA
ncbi:MAG: hypothetical protein H6Q84_3639 [Deltaproteobacteria bacterium]|nr:hypothetical protein [Deltaproteobacteria bacterium]